MHRGGIRLLVLRGDGHEREAGGRGFAEPSMDSVPGDRGFRIGCRWTRGARNRWRCESGRFGSGEGGSDAGSMLQGGESRIELACPRGVERVNIGQLGGGLGVGCDSLRKAIRERRRRCPRPRDRPVDPRDPIPRKGPSVNEAGFLCPILSPRGWGVQF